MNSPKYRAISAVFALMLLCLTPVVLFARGNFDPDDIGPGVFYKPNATNTPCANLAMHTVNKMGLCVTNQGFFGTGFLPGATGTDPITGAVARSASYPYPSSNTYLFAGAFWIGSIVGRDTLVSVGADGWSSTQEMWPPPCALNGDIQRLSISNPEDVVAGALSEQDFISHYTDTLTDQSYVSIDPIDGRPHQPLNIEITEKSLGWSYSYAEDFILFDYAIKNIGRRDLDQVYMGIYVDGDVGPASSSTGVEFKDDICGFKRDLPTPLPNIDPSCGFRDTINIAWIADNDGKLNDPALTCPSGFDVPHVTGTRVVRTPSDSLKYSFNWWVSNTTPNLDFGPRKSGTATDPFRDFGGFLGTPEGDKNKYYIMRHEEFDYDQMFSAVDQTAEGWLPPGPEANDIANGFDTRYLLSFGPFNISPGEVLRLSFAYIGGRDFHRHCEDFKNLWNPQMPQEYYDSLNFQDLGLNSVWASWIYDNPNRDSNGNHFLGKYRVCCKEEGSEIDTISLDPLVTETLTVCIKADTMWYEGDGIPDFEGARPPVAPKFWVTPTVNEFNEGELGIRINGFESETTPDNFSGLIDFEGYRIYYSLSSDPEQFVLLTSYDIDDFNRWEYDSNNGIWVLRQVPFTLAQLQEMYGPDFNPSLYTVDNLYYDTEAEQYYYFTPQDWNRSDLSDTTLIHKIYPDEPLPISTNPDSAAVYHPEELTDDGYFKYYEYEYTIRKLLPSQLYYVAVTAFDYGSPSSGLPSLETAVSKNMISEYAQYDNSTIEEKGLNVVVYPNPYRIDANYQNAEGGNFEGRDVPDPNTERDRLLHFANLPNKCTIRIYTIDGDLVRQIDHDKPKDSNRAMHETWDLITRNTQAVVSGIYYYSVESESGNQIGKIVIIK